MISIPFNSVFVNHVFGNGMFGQILSVNQLQELDIQSLIEYVYKHPQQKRSASLVMQKNFRIYNKKIFISRGADFDGMQYILEDDTLTIRDLDLAIKLVRGFCTNIKNILFWDYYFPEQERRKIEQLIRDINQHCTNVIEIGLPIESYSHIINPFHRAEIVTVSEMNNDEDEELNRIYPQMRELIIEHFIDMSPEKKAVYHPKLKKLKYSGHEYTGHEPQHGETWTMEHSVEKILDQNNQIDTIHLTRYPPIDFLNRLSQMPNIKTFILMTYEMVERLDPTPIYFSNIRNFTLINDHCSKDDPIALPLVFNVLASFNYRCKGTSAVNNDWLRMVPNTQYLKDISLPNMELNTQDIANYSDHIQSLQSIAVKYSINDPHLYLIPFLEHTRLSKITLNNVDLHIVNGILRSQSLSGIFAMEAFITDQTKKRCIITIKRLTNS